MVLIKLCCSIAIVSGNFYAFSQDFFLSDVLRHRKLLDCSEKHEVIMHENQKYA